MSRAVVQSLKDDKTNSMYIRDLEECLRLVRRIASSLNLSDNVCIAKAEEYCRLTIDKEFGKAFSPHAFSAACIYYACRVLGQPRTFNEICKESKSSRRNLGHCYKSVVKHVESKEQFPDRADVQDSSETFIERFCKELGFDNEIVLATKNIFKEAMKKDLALGRSPLSVIGAAIYLASQASVNKKTQKMIAQVAGISPMTIRAVYKQLCPRVEELFPVGFKFHTPIEELPLS